MLLDSRLEFADALTVAAAATTIAVIPNSNIIDLGSYLGGAAGATEKTPDVALGEPLWLVGTVDTEVITGGSAGTLQFALYSNATADLASTPTLHYTSPSFVTDDAAANSDALNAGGTLFAVQLPLGSYQRYLVLGYIIGTTTITAGKINAFLTHDVSKWVAPVNAVNG